uniref:Amidohydrolase-related domain-containing protein n=1 Tax=Ditylenchus dipsaci TaxID=166011 RepID=A0A915CU79_9BILA
MSADRIPLRPQLAHSEDALEMLANNPLCMCVSDHHITKIASTLNGMVKTTSSGIIPSSAGIEERMSVLWEKAVVQLGKLDPMRFVAGRVAVGSDADLVLWDLDSSRQLSSLLTPFHQMSVRATPMTTICAGQVLYTDGKFVGPSRTGQTSSKTGVAQDYFLPLEANSPYVRDGSTEGKTFNLSLQAVGRGKPETRSG